MLTPATQRVIRRVMAASGPQASARQPQPPTEARQQHQRLPELPQQLEDKLPAPGADGGAGSAGGSHTAQEHAVLRPLQLQQTVLPAAAASPRRATAVAGAENQPGASAAKAGHAHGGKLTQQLQQSRQPLASSQQQAQAGGSAVAGSGGGGGEHELTPRAARTLRREQLKQQLEQRQQERGGAAAAAGPLTVAPVSEEEFERLPGWCKGLLSAALLNGVLAALQELHNTAAASCADADLQQQAEATVVAGFTAVDVEQMGHSTSKSKTIVSCLHKLNRATLQRAAGGGAGTFSYRLVGSQQVAGV
jgi:hypothetical protein